MKRNTNIKPIFTSVLASFALFVSFAFLNAENEPKNQLDPITKNHIQNQLNKVKITPDFEDQPLQSILKWIRREKVDFPMVIGKTVNKTISITKQFQEPVTIKQFFQLIFDQHGLTAIYDGGALRIAPEKKEITKTHRLYDVRDLLSKRKDFDSVQMMLSNPDAKEGKSNSNSLIPGAVFRENPEPKNDLMNKKENLLESIRENTGSKEDWTDNAGMKLQNGILIVNQTPSVQREIHEFITRLRKFKQ